MLEKDYMANSTSSHCKEKTSLFKITMDLVAKNNFSTFLKIFELLQFPRSLHDAKPRLRKNNLGTVNIILCFKTRSSVIVT